jgi:predicted negative regulator of RcsB-dependent stress response
MPSNIRLVTLDDDLNSGSPDPTERNIVEIVSDFERTFYCALGALMKAAEDEFENRDAERDEED